MEANEVSEFANQMKESGESAESRSRVFRLAFRFLLFLWRWLLFLGIAVTLRPF